MTERGGTVSAPDTSGGVAPLEGVLEALDRLALTLSTDAAEQERLQRARQEWVAGVSHDLKAPLTAIRGYAELLSAGIVPPQDIQRQAASIVARCTTMARLIGDLDFTMRVREGGALMLRHDLVDVVELARDVVAEHEDDPWRQGEPLSLTVPDAPATVLGDRDLLRRAIANTLVNAIMHNPPTTAIGVSVIAEDDHVSVVVEDRGAGIDPAMLETVATFGALPVTPQPSSGMGMSIVRQFVMAHNGRLDVTSERGSGTRVEMMLPKAGSGGPTPV